MSKDIFSAFGLDKPKSETNTVIKPGVRHCGGGGGDGGDDTAAVTNGSANCSSGACGSSNCYG